MKKLFALLLSCSMITCAFSACGDEETSGESSDISSSSSVNSESSDESSSEESSSESDSESESESSSESEVSSESESESSSESEVSSESESESSSESEVSSESSSESDTSESEIETESGQASIEITPGTASDPKLIGAWTNDEMSAAYSSIKFSEDGIISAVVDCSSIMSISGEYLNMSGTQCPYTFDGTDFSCILTNENMGITDSESQTEELSILEMTKIEPGDKSDINGVYILNGGVLNEAYAASLPIDCDIYITVSNNSNITMEVPVCGYDSDGANITWKGDTEELLGFSSEEAVTPYTIDGDTVTIISGGTEEVLTRNRNIN